MSPQFFPVDYDPWADPEDTASAGYAGVKKLAGAVYHTVVDPWTRPLSEPYKGAVLPFSSQGRGDLSFDPGAGLLGGIKSGATLPADVYAGRVNPLSSEGFGRVQDAASLLSGGPMLGGGGAKASMGFGGGDGVFTNITKALKNKSAYHPDMNPDELVAHALEASGGDAKKAKDFIETKYNEQALGAKAEENHYAAYDTLGQMGKGKIPETIQEPLPGSLPSTPHLSWTKGEDPKDLLAHDWITPHGLTSDEDPAHVAGMVLAASGGDVDKAKGLLKNNPFEHSSFFAPDKDTLVDAAKHLDNPYFADETHTPVPLNADAAKQYNAFTDLPGYQDEEGKKLANETFHIWLSNNEEHPSKLGDGVAGKDPWADLQSVTHPGMPAGEGEWPDLQAEMHKLLGTPEHAIPLTQSIHPDSGHLDWTVGKTPHDLIQNHLWVAPDGNTDMPLTALKVFNGDKDKATNYMKTMLEDKPELKSIFSEKDLTDPIKNFSGDIKDLPLPLSPEHEAAFKDAVNKGGIPYNTAEKDVHKYLKFGFNSLVSVDHDYKKWHFPKLDFFKNTESSTPGPKPSFTGPPAPPSPLSPLPIEGRHGPFVPEPPAIYRPFVGKSSYKNALQPFDWQSDSSPLLSGNGNVRGLEQYIPGINRLTDDDLQRILEQGHNPNLPLFKGLQGEKEQYAYERGQFTNPLLKPGINAERGIFFGNLPNVADQYGNRRAFFARPQNPLDFDWANTVGYDGYSSEMSNVLDSAWDRGGDAVRIRNIRDVGHTGLQSQYVFRDPMALRYTHAKFDPKHVDSPQLSWTGGVPVFAQPVDYDPWEKSQ